MHEAAVADGSQQKREGEIKSQNAGPKIALGQRDRVTRAQCDILKYAAVLSQRNFAFGATVQIVEHGPRQAAARQRPEIGDADDAGSGGDAR
jgi:hypothetical protein